MTNMVLRSISLAVLLIAVAATLTGHVLCGAALAGIGAALLIGGWRE